jgi:hypothetical protein
MAESKWRMDLGLAIALALGLCHEKAKRIRRRGQFEFSHLKFEI